MTDHVRLDYMLQNRPELLRQLLDDPQRIFDELGIDESALICPPLAHEALNKGEMAAELANQLSADLPPGEALPQLTAIIREQLGDDFRAAKVPFGIRFAEPVRDAFAQDLTGTASVECTFGLECKGDVDG